MAGRLLSLTVVFPPKKYFRSRVKLAQPEVAAKLAGLPAYIFLPKQICYPTQAVPLQFFTFVFRHRAYGRGQKHCACYPSARGAPAPRVTGWTSNRPDHLKCARISECARISDHFFTVGAKAARRRQPAEGSSPEAARRRQLAEGSSPEAARRSHRHHREEG